MSVPEQTIFTSSTANGVTTVFPYSFMIADADDLTVELDGVVQTVGFTVSGVGDPSGGNVTFSVPPANGVKVLRYLDPVLRREIDYQQFGDLLAPSLNSDFDRMWLALQALNQKFTRALKLPTDTAEDQVISENAAGRANRYIAFDSDGNLALATELTVGALVVTGFIETLLDDLDAATARATLGLVIGSDVQASLVSGSNIKTLNGASILGAGDISVGMQIQPISASVAANAMTISASALSLDFRSTTLGSGAVTTVSGTPSNLVISSGSTLGTVSGQQSRIAVLAINNAGTIELAAVNVAGGNDLSETGVISTTAEGGAGSADSANVVYSNTARTNVAYRVIGYIESTQATAGTWATAPSTIQGAGGQATTAMSSLGYGQTWQNVTGSRTSGTTYYNTTGRPIFVRVQNSTSGSISVVVGGVTIGSSGATVAGCMDFIVPPGNSYSATFTTSSLHYWSELR